MNWTDWTLQHEIPLRLGLFIGVFVVMALWEQRLPKRRLQAPKHARWLNNIALVVLNSLVLRILFPTAAAGVALFAEIHGWGLLNALPLPELVAVVVAMIALDFAIYTQHVVFHRVPWLWRLHQVHHADVDFDVTTGARFHTLEIILSMLIKFAVIVLLGAPAVAVVLFEVLLNAGAMFNHANVSLPARLDRALRWIIVTPDMHRVHHSVRASCFNTNFGFNLPWWDRLFGTYRAQPEESHEEMLIGQRGLRDPKHVQWLPGVLMLPFQKS